MGAWGIKALESDEGLDVVDYLTEYIPKHYDLKLSEVIAAMKDEGFFGEDFEDIEFFFDHSAMTLSELYLIYSDTGKLDYDDDEEDEKVFSKIRSFSADNKSIDFLLRYLTDIRDQVPDVDGEREIVELWKDSSEYQQWNEHLLWLINRLNKIQEEIK